MPVPARMARRVADVRREPPASLQKVLDPKDSPRKNLPVGRVLEHLATVPWRKAEHTACTAFMGPGRGGTTVVRRIALKEPRRA